MTADQADPTHATRQGPGERLPGGLVAWLIATALSFGASSVRAQDAMPPDRLVGDIGVAAYHTRAIVRDQRDSTRLLPYAYADFGRLFARIDTLGVRLLPLGRGYLELVGRVSFDGFDPASTALHGLGERRDALPLGLGSYQRLPFGGLFLYGFHDFGRSGGHLLEAIYAARLEAGTARFYPQFGIEYRSAGMNRYFHGVSAAESAAHGTLPTYSPGGGTSPLAALMVQMPLSARVDLFVYGKRKWLSAAISDSPVIGRSHQDLLFAGVSYRFD